MRIGSSFTIGVPAPRAHGFEPVAVADRYLLADPHGPDAPAFEAQVACTFYDAARDEPEVLLHASRREEGEDEVEANSHEVQGSVMATRLLWAPGVAADLDYPVRPRCLDCPADPWKVARDEHSHPVTSEADRAFLAVEQLIDLFTASRVERLHETVSPARGI